jgi:splicing factor 3B subunit 3
MYRSYYVPVKGAIDGDLCERYIRLDETLRDRIAGEVERAAREVERKISVRFFKSEWNFANYS